MASDSADPLLATFLAAARREVDYAVVYLVVVGRRLDKLLLS